jgi:hypothetical protein
MAESPHGFGPITATLVPRGPAAAIVLEAEQVATVGEGAKRFSVVATVNDHTWRTTVTRMRGEFLVGLNRAVRQAAGVEAGDTVVVNLALHTAPARGRGTGRARQRSRRGLRGTRCLRPTGLHPPQGVRPLDRRRQARADAPAAGDRSPRDAEARKDSDLSHGAFVAFRRVGARHRVRTTRWSAAISRRRSGFE